jgi:para-aminobenzoate synthetase / 4-amino-4-deoxychorismate lyase
MTRAILDFPGGPRQCFHGPTRVIEAWDVASVLPAVRAAEAECAAGRWAVGYVAYEAAPAFDAALTTRPPEPGMPLAWFGVFDGPAGSLEEAAGEDSSGGNRTGSRAPGDAAPAPRHPATLPPPLRWSSSVDRPTYDAAVAEIRRRIAAGAVYQVNHTLRFTADVDAPAHLLYEALVRGRHGRYHAYLEHAGWAVVSASPELFFDLAPDGTITTRPMKGTLRRGRWLEEDRQAAAILADSAKDRAENLMIVDLLRNDLGRVARFGTVQVPRLFEVETYPTVHQLTSTVTARLRPGLTLCDVLAATFPCGSVTGAPKVTAMRAIADLEDTPRGVYCGAVGVIRGDGSATFNVAIRTIAVDGRHAVYGAGGGITWDSRADAEYDEVVAKAALLRETSPSFRLLETMRLQDGRIHRLERHLHRLRESAEYWGFASVVVHRARERLAALSAAHPSGCFRVRLTAGPGGEVETTVGEACGAFTPLGACGAGSGAVPPASSEAGAATLPPADVPRYALARKAVSAANRLLYHKTTARALYDDHRADFPDAFDVLLFNDEGRVTEFTFGNVVACIDGKLLTPPRQDGLLAGTYRQELLDAGAISEAPITLADLRRASAVYHVNSVRGATRLSPTDP